MISAASVHSFAERKTKNLFNMRPGWLKKDAAAETATAAVSSPDSPKIKELASSLYGKPKALSRPRIRELLTIAMIRLMERMIAELFPCADDDNAGFAGAGQAEMPSGTPLPSFEEFLKHICRRTRTPLTCMCLALLYLTRLRANHPRSRGSPGSSYRLALSSLCVATKYLYDDAYHTCSWVQVSMGLFSQREVNQMEMEFMYFLRYQLGVTPTEWNQWIATLEAKLVARWQEKGKAEVIYGFGLFLSYECCEASAQEAVRDIAWGEGGKSLLALLSNAIHSTGAVGESKGSPSADSAVSDTTCLPTPDPNAWFRIRSPALSGNDDPSGINVSQAFRATGSTSITPTSAQMTEVADPSRYMAAMSKAHPVSAPGCSSSAYGDQKQESSHYGHQKHGYDAGERRHGSWTSHPPFVHHGAGSSGHSHSMRPSSVCSVPALPTTTAASYSEGNMRHVVGVGSHSTTYRHASDSKSNDWRLLHPARQAHSSCEPSPLPQHQQNWQGASVNIQTQCNGIPPPRLAHLGSESTMVANVHGARHRVNMDSPFNSFSEITATMSLSYSGDSRDDGVLGSADHVVLNVRRTSGCGGGNGSSTTHCYSGTRPSSIAISSGLRVGSANPNTGFDSKSVYSGTSMLSKSGSSGGAIPGLSGSLIPNNVHSQSSQGTLNAFSGGSATNGPAKRGSAGKHSGATRPTARRATGSSSMAPSLNAASPSAERQGNNSRHTGGVGSSQTATTSNGASASGSCAPSTKSSASSLKASMRRQNWRHSTIKSTTASSFAQKLRSFAAFGWGGSNGGHTGNSVQRSAQMLSSTKGLAGCNSVEDLPYKNNVGDDKGFEQHITVGHGDGGYLDSKRNSCIPLSTTVMTDRGLADDRGGQQSGYPLNTATTAVGTVSQIGFARRFTDTQTGQRAPLANVQAEMENNAASSLGF